MHWEWELQGWMHAIPQNSLFCIIQMVLPTFAVLFANNFVVLLSKVPGLQ
jgi:hypothetical protein